MGTHQPETIPASDTQTTTIKSASGLIGAITVNIAGVGQAEQQAF
jgi:hypothetical protein